jgi:quinol monooxygenase YgiN
VAIAMIFDTPGVTQAQYDQVHDAVTPDNRPPPGLLYHVAGPTENGFCVVEVWESQDAASTFFQEKLGQALQQAGITAPPRVFHVHNTMQAR